MKTVFKKFLPHLIFFILLIALASHGIFWRYASEISKSIKTLQREANEQKVSIYLQQFALFKTMLEKPRAELSRSLQVLLSYGELGDLLNNSTLNYNSGLRLELWLKATVSNLSLDQIVVFDQEGHVIAGLKDQILLGPSGLVDGSNIIKNYRPLISQALEGRGSEFYDLFPEPGYLTNSLSYAYIFPVKDRANRTVGILGVLKTIHREKLYATYQQSLGKNAPQPFIQYLSEQAIKAPIILDSIVNHHQKPVAIVGIRRSKDEKDLLALANARLESIQEGHAGAFFLLAFFTLIALLFGKREKSEVTPKREGLGVYQNAQDILKNKSHYVWHEMLLAKTSRPEKSSPVFRLVVDRSSQKPDQQSESEALPVRFTGIPNQQKEASLSEVQLEPIKIKIPQDELPVRKPFEIEKTPVKEKPAIPTHEDEIHIDDLGEYCPKQTPSNNERKPSKSEDQEEKEDPNLLFSLA